MSGFKYVVLIILAIMISLTGSFVFAADVFSAEDSYNNNELFNDEPYLGKLVGNVDVRDAVRILRHISGIDPFADISNEDDSWQRADVNLSGSVDVADAILILRYTVGLIDGFTPENPATVFTEKALRHALQFEEVDKVFISRDISLSKPLSVKGEMTLKGNRPQSNETHIKLDGEVLFKGAGTPFKTEEIKIETLTLSGNSNEINQFSEPAYISDTVIKRLNVESYSDLRLTGDTSIENAFFYDGASISGGNSIDMAWIAPGLSEDDVIFGDSMPQQPLFLAEIKTFSYNDLNIESATRGLQDANEGIVKIAIEEDNFSVTSLGEGETIISMESFSGKKASMELRVEESGALKVIRINPHQNNITDAPEITTEEPGEPVESIHFTLEGLSEPGADIWITGSEEPVQGKADENGVFNLELVLKNNEKNILLISARAPGKDISKSVTFSVTHAEQ